MFEIIANNHLSFPESYSMKLVEKNNTENIFYAMSPKGLLDIKCTEDVYLIPIIPIKFINFEHADSHMISITLEYNDGQNFVYDGRDLEILNVLGLLVYKFCISSINADDSKLNAVKIITDYNVNILHIAFLEYTDKN